MLGHYSTKEDKAKERNKLYTRSLKNYSHKARKTGVAEPKTKTSTADPKNQMQLKQIPIHTIRLSRHTQDRLHLPFIK
jgi:hypothetical protein